ncbi:MAG: single-stranded-DNA-specific exonuclease RecJ [Chloroflexota bacterium]
MQCAHKAQWNILPPAPNEYLATAPVPPLIGQLLYNRAIPTSKLESFLSSQGGPEANPFLLPDVSVAVARIYRALLHREKMAVYGDFDVDGVTATALLVRALEKLGASVSVYIPERTTEGHGLKEVGLEQLQRDGVTLVVTVDCGISDLAAARKAAAMGLDLIITDHHIPLPDLPPASAVVNPQRDDSRYPYADFCGAGLAFKLAEALFHKDRREPWLHGMLDLVALGTVTDLVPLTDENRYLVKEGLKVLNSTSCIGLQALISTAGLEPGKLDAASITWALGPRLNAAGRMDSASTSYRLLTTESADEAQGLALELEARNAERKRLADAACSRALDRLASRLESPLLFDADEAYPVGVMGLVASKLEEQFYRPAIIVNLGPEFCKGSARSIPEFNLAQALARCQDLLSAFGGHPQAAGFTARCEDLPRLEERLLDIAHEQLSGLDLRPRLTIDAEVSPSAFAGDTFSLMQRMEPFGQRNAVPTFLSRGVEVLECHTCGERDRCLRLKLKHDGVVWQAMDYDPKSHYQTGTLLDIVYTVRKARWNGQDVLQFKLLDSAPSGSLSVSSR